MQELRNLKFTLEEVEKVGFTKEKLLDRWLTLEDLENMDFTLENLKDLGFTLELKSLGFSPEELKILGFSLEKLKDHFELKELRPLYRLSDLRELYSDEELRKAGATERALKKAGMNLSAVPIDNSTKKTPVVKFNEDKNEVTKFDVYKKMVPTSKGPSISRLQTVTTLEELKEKRAAQLKKNREIVYSYHKPLVEKRLNFLEEKLKMSGVVGVDIEKVVVSIDIEKVLKEDQEVISQLKKLVEELKQIEGNVINDADLKKFFNYLKEFLEDLKERYPLETPPSQTGDQTLK